jgi:methyl-accepting chemotaxis protein
MLSRLKIAHRIAIAIAVPMLGLIVLFATMATESFSKYREMGFLSQVGDAVAELTLITHELQAERAASIALLSGAGGSNAGALDAARSQVDAETAKLHEVTEHLKGGASADLVHEFEQIEEEVAGLAGLRDGVDARTASAADVSKSFSKVIHHIVEVGFHASGLSSDGKITREIIALVDLSEAKEFAAQERLLVSKAIRTGTMSDADFIRFNQLIAEQNLLEEAFVANQPASHREAYAARLEGSGKETLNELRQSIVSSGGAMSLASVPSAAWQEAMGHHIDELHGLEVQASADIHEDAVHIAGAEFNSMLLHAGFGVAVLLVALVAGFVMARSITKPLGLLTEGMDRVSSGDIDAPVHGADRVDEIGNMARALQAFKDGSAEKAMLEREAEKVRLENERAREEREAEKAKRDAKTREAVNALADGLGKLAEGDLTVSIATPFEGELEPVRTDFNAAVAKLCDTFVDIKTSIDSVFSDASEMRSSADSLSERTERQAASLEETSAALEELTSTVKSSSESAGLANQKAADAKKNSDNSASVVADAVSAMTRIESASGEIANIIGLIDEIAFQTNLLALNAGVEAARAGEAGKGFAVVAQEVRELAQRSAQAAKDIKDLIAKSTGEVESGVQLVKATGEALEGIAADVSSINEMIDTIAGAAKEQSVGLGECNTAVSQMDQFTQHNAAMVEETTATTHRLSHEAENLARLVEQFKLTQGAVAHAHQEEMAA